MKKKFLFSLLSLMLVGMSAFNMGVSVKAQEKLEVKTTFYPVYFLAEQIGGDYANVSMLLEANQDAHDYEISASDVTEVQNADLFIYQDDEMEYFVQDLLAVINTENTKIVESTEGLTLLTGSDTHDHEGEEAADDHDHEGEEAADEHDHEEGAHEEDDHDHEEDDHAHEEDDNAHDHGAEEDGHSHNYDPHTWVDPMFYAQQAENVLNAFVELDPANAEGYQNNYQALVDELTLIDEEYRTALADREDRRFVVQHAAFGYLANAYDLEQVAITGLSTTQEPSAQEIATMQDFVVENDVKVIYVDPTSSSSIAQTVAQANNAELRPLRTLESVTADELAQGINYFDIMRDNLIELAK
ncbi:metal ABC transporter solute-binding protein, Zn/Mn family [Fundicoccus culcitae]|uniref:Zinc ABC transporter substrate-binding protein n=1 Tax=Fundicoccus culcitae TaxID=2969821 RepID=A0ABY5P2K9_9LACT|nr:zinc ABC transporter substrate-binding protein [Fundicoccus culcitae]UUX32957.1 zinc ABC transporter substrate-binding protein [Fundicoccus culcitae]